jgi:hydrogenase/urease accessory protein HupE
VKKGGNDMKNIETRKTIALFLTLVFGVLVVVGFAMGKDIPAPVYAIISMVIGYYFGKSTALDKPQA